jgi:hypothetical protein
MHDVLVLHIYSTVKNHFLVHICPYSILMHIALKKSNLYTQSRIETNVLVLGMFKVKAIFFVSMTSESG